MDHFTHIHNQGSASISATHSPKKSTQHQTTMAMKNLPEHIIIEILLRLPVKSLLRFRSVSKLWNSLISDPQFAKSHFDLAAAQTDRIMYIVNSEVRCIDFEASFHDDSSSVKLNFPLIAPNFHPWIRGSCRGFLLLEDYGDFFIYNPSTNVCKRISYSPISMNIQFATVLHGFGYDASKDDYLIVLGSYELNAEILVTHFEIFSFRTNSWKEIEGTHFPYMNAVDDPRAGILLNGAIHWFAYNYDRLSEVILAFDLIEKSSRELPMPNDFNQSLEFCGLEVLGGCLGLYILGDDDAEIWIMKEYGVKSSWTKSIVVSLKGNHSCYFSPICFTKGGDIVGEDGGTGLVKYNHNGELLEHHDYCHDKHGCQVAMYTESLLSLPSDSGGGGHWKQN